MAEHEQHPLTFNQTQTGSNQVDRAHFRAPQFPGPQTPSQPFDVQKGKAVLTDEEKRSLNRILSGLRKAQGLRQGSLDQTAASAFGRAFKF